MTDSGTAGRSRRGWRDIHGLGRFGKFVTVALAAAAFSGAATALPLAPTKKPSETYKSAWLDTSDFSQLTRALEAADARRWADVRSAIGRISDPSAKLLLQWRLVTDGDSGTPYADLLAAAETFAGWPDRDKILDQLEIGIAASPMTAQDRITWLRARGPATGEGILAIADAYNSLGQPDQMIATARAGWRDRALSDQNARALQALYGQYLTAEDHYQRVDMLLWRRNVTEARSLLGRLDADRRKLVEARIALMQNQKNVDALVQAVPASMQDDGGLLYERARWRDRRGQLQGELELLLRLKGSDAREHGREAIWSEKHSVIRRLIREKQFSNAYLLAADNGLTSGEAFRDAEWLAGWLALTKLGDAAKAEGHFRTFAAGVETPISISRGQYWLGEALARQQRTAEAQVAYAAGAQYPFVFYGQLAAEKVNEGAPLMSFASFPHPTDEDRAAFARKPAVRAAILLAETGRLGSFERFSNAIDDTLASPAEHQMLYDIAQGYLEARAALRGAKAGLQRGIVAPDAVFPIMPLPASTRNGAAEPAMVLALTRQESEFNPRAVSSANARGLMQMIPRYAQDEARKVGVTFRQSWLTDDPEFNLRLGRGFLDELVVRYGGSYVLAAAAYNAGPSRAWQWISDFGDPRGGQVDPVDWIESIPFAETRNYVQRVLENTQVYRHRLNGQPTPITLSEDLKRGR